MLIATTRHAISRRSLGLITSTSVQHLPYRRLLQTQVTAEPNVPFRKQLKDEIQSKRQYEKPETPQKSQKRAGDELLSQWELTVGLEIHAQLNTEHKLFSRESYQNVQRPKH